MYGVTETAVGRAMAALGRMVGPRRTLERMQRNLRNSDNFIASFFQGILDARISIAGAREPQVSLVRREGSGGIFRVRWRA